MTLTDRGGTPALVVNAKQALDFIKGDLVMDKRQIGWFILKQDKVYCDNGYECAAWYENIAVNAGKYPLMVNRYDTRPDGQVGSRGVDMASVALDGVVVDDYFGSMFCGVPVGTYDCKKNAGKRSTYYWRWYLYGIAHDLLDGKTNDEYSIELLPEYEAREIWFEYDGEQHCTHGIFEKGAC